MNRRLLARLTVSAMVLALAIPATASAPVGQYDTFNQNDATIHDAKTALRWQRGSATAMSWDDASNYCRALILGGIPVGTWRLPSVKELLTLIDEKGESEYVTNRGVVYYAIDLNAFPRTPSGLFWAWPQLVNGRGWTVDFSNGETGTQPVSTSYYVRCVH